MLREDLEARLERMFQSRGPRWGDPEAYELQVLLLLELLYFPDDPDAFMQLYNRFLAQRLPAVQGSRMSSVLSSHDSLAMEMRAFKTWLERRLPMRPPPPPGIQGP